MLAHPQPLRVSPPEFTLILPSLRVDIITVAPRGTGTSSGYPAAWENQAAPPSGTPPVPIHATPTPTSAHGVLRSDHRNAAVQYNGRDVGACVLVSFGDPL